MFKNHIKQKKKDLLEQFNSLFNKFIIKFKIFEFNIVFNYIIDIKQ